MDASKKIEEVANVSHMAVDVAVKLRAVALTFVAVHTVRNIWYGLCNKSSSSASNRPPLCIDLCRKDDILPL